MASAVPAHKDTIIDAFAGAGGNTIAFARSGRWSRIFAFEKDPDVLKCAKHNAEVYGVANKIWWIQGDCFEEAKKRFPDQQEHAVVFASPPWGGNYAQLPGRVPVLTPASQARPIVATKSLI